MDSPRFEPKTTPGDAHRLPAQGLRSVVRKTALLNLTVVLTSFPVLAAAGGPDSLMLIIGVMLVVSELIWALTFAVYAFVTLFGLFRITPAKPSQPVHVARSGVSDRWLDDTI